MSKTKPPMTQGEYVFKQGGSCPVCQSFQLKGGSVQIEAGKAWQEINCMDCNSSWNDVYLLTKYENLETP